MPFLQKSLLVLFVLGIGCFIITKTPLTSRDRVLPGAVNTLSGEPKRQSDVFTAHTHGSHDNPHSSATHESIPRQTKSNHRLQAYADKQPSEKDDHFAEATRVSPLRKSRKFSPIPSHLTQIPTPPASLVWIDGLIPEHDAAIQRLAEDFKQNLQAPSQPPSSSADYARSYQEEARLNDIRFQTRHGDLLWMRHHIAAHHLDSGVAPAK